MGTSGAYTGAGGKAGKEVSEGLGEWIDSLPDSQPGLAEDQSDSEANDQTVPPLPPKMMSGLMGLLHRRSPSGSADGPSGGGGGAAGGGTGRTRAGSGRSAQRMSSVGGRAAAGAYAFARGDTSTLERLGLDYAELSALGDQVAVGQRIVDAVCGEFSVSNLESEEERWVAATVVDWIFQHEDGGAGLEPDETARFTIGTVIFEVLSSEINTEGGNPDGSSPVREDELRDAATAVTRQLDLTVTGPSEDELSTAIEQGLEMLRAIYGGDG